MRLPYSSLFSVCGCVGVWVWGVCGCVCVGVCVGVCVCVCVSPAKMACKQCVDKMYNDKGLFFAGRGISVAKFR